MQNSHSSRPQAEMGIHQLLRGAHVGLETRPTQNKPLVLWKKVPGQVRELKACRAQGAAAGSESRLCSELLGTPRLSLAQSPAAPRGARGGVGATSPAVAVTCTRGQSQSALALQVLRTVMA